MGLLVQTLNSELKTLMDNKIRLQVIGDIDSLDASCQAELANTIKSTAGNDRLTLILALSYSARWEITEAAKRIALDAKNDKLEMNAIN